MELKEAILMAEGNFTFELHTALERNDTGSAAKFLGAITTLRAHLAELEESDADTMLRLYPRACAEVREATANALDWKAKYELEARERNRFHSMWTEAGIEINKLKDKLAALKQGVRTEWVEMEEGEEFKGRFERELHIGDGSLTVLDNSDKIAISLALPDDIRLCRRVTKQPVSQPTHFVPTLETWREHKDAKWIATDEDGGIVLFRTEPIITTINPLGAYWGTSEGNIGRLGAIHTPVPDWRESLYARPAEADREPASTYEEMVLNEVEDAIEARRNAKIMEATREAFKREHAAKVIVGEASGWFASNVISPAPPQVDHLVEAKEEIEGAINAEDGTDMLQCIGYAQAHAAIAIAESLRAIKGLLTKKASE